MKTWFWDGQKAPSQQKSDDLKTQNCRGGVKAMRS